LSKPRPKIYLAGPEVFVPEARALGEEKARLCAAAGFEGLFPLDTSLDLNGLSKAEQALRIYRADVGLMLACDAAIANLTPFRGVSMDCGTAYELGFMRALGRLVFGYSNAADDYVTRAAAYRARATGLADADRPDATIEDVGLAENLMIEIAIEESGGKLVRRAVQHGQEMTDLEGFKACLEQARQLLLSAARS
jgi:nucleoside 2-deoxyribosyltransferase